MPAAGEPCPQPFFTWTQVAVRDADLLKPELPAPALDVAGERSQIRRLRFHFLHTPNFKPQFSRFLPDAAATLELGRALAQVLEPGLIVWLEGDLGAGKTTLARGILRGLGYAGRVKSPTFTLVEAYSFFKLNLYHFDFYRFNDPRELADSGLTELFNETAVCLIEWPEKASGLPRADVRIRIRVTDDGRTVDLHADTELGALCLQTLQDTRST
jgi:tRNA threonylcarbamoyladenosine biosynthesis protein TsaE